jgi:hypothetical protein
MQIGTPSGGVPGGYGDRNAENGMESWIYPRDPANKTPMAGESDPDALAKSLFSFNKAKSPNAEHA